MLSLRAWLSAAPLTAWLKRQLYRAGYDVRRVVNTFEGQGARLLARRGVTLVLDVGAYVGAYGRQLRRLGYRGRLVSFEPLAASFAQLQAQTRRDPRWTAVNLALGAHDATAQLHQAGNQKSSSLLTMLPAHLAAAPYAAYQGAEPVSVRPLDAVFAQYGRAEDRVFLKLDTQGYERPVLDGAARTLPQVVGLQVELSFTPLYAGEMTFAPLLAHLESLGFNLLALAPAFHAPSGRLLQVDGLFEREH